MTNAKGLGAPASPGAWARAGAALALLLTSGCNAVYTHAPLFAAAKGDAPGLRPGVWAAPDGECAFDEKAAADRWPQCASASIVTDRELKAVKVGHGGASPDRAGYVLAGGDPRILQIQVVMPPQRARRFGSGYLYMALRPSKTDASGQIVAFTAWLVQCGPPPETQSETTAATLTPGPGKTAPYGTRKPLAGLVMDHAGATCATRSLPALRAAAVASEAWTAPAPSSHWVRDGER